MFIPQKLFDTKEYQDLSTTNKAILMAFYSIADGDEKSKTYKTTRYFASRETLSKRSGYNQRTITDNIPTLLETPFLIMVRRTSTAKIYQLIDDVDFAELLKSNKVTIIEDSWTNREKNSEQAKYFKNDVLFEGNSDVSFKDNSDLLSDCNSDVSSEGTHINSDSYIISNIINNNIDINNSSSIEEELIDIIEENTMEYTQEERQVFIDDFFGEELNNSAEADCSIKNEIIHNISVKDTNTADAGCNDKLEQGKAYLNQLLSLRNGLGWDNGLSDELTAQDEVDFNNFMKYINTDNIKFLIPGIKKNPRIIRYISVNNIKTAMKVLEN